DLDEDLGFEQLAAHVEAHVLPGAEVLAQGDHAAGARRFANAVVLDPVRRAGAARGAAAGGRPRVDDIGAPVDVHFTLFGGVPGVDRHVVVRVVDDVPLDARVRGPPVHADVRVAARAARFAGDELRRDRAALIVGHRGLSETPPLVAESTEVSARVVPRRDERRDLVDGELALAGVGPDLPREVALPSRVVHHLRLSATRHRRVAVGLADGSRAARSASGAARRSASGAARRSASIAAARERTARLEPASGFASAVATTGPTRTSEAAAGPATPRRAAAGRASTRLETTRRVSSAATGARAEAPRSIAARGAASARTGARASATSRRGGAARGEPTRAGLRLPARGRAALTLAPQAPARLVGSRTSHRAAT